MSQTRVDKRYGYIIPVLLLLVSLPGCVSDVARAQIDIDEGECLPTSSRLVEGRIQDALDESGLANTGLLIERADG